MSEEIKPADAAPETPAKKTVTQVIFTPAAVHIPVKLRANAIQLVKELKPPGNPKPFILEAARTAILALIDSFPEDVNGIEVKLEIGGASAHQMMVIVFPHKI
jgi:hypothetical protein